MDKEYEICKQACKNAGCAIPESHEFHGAVANTLMYLRVYFHAKGFADAIEDSGITEERNPAHFCNCGNYLGFRGFCSTKCHDDAYDSNNE